MSDFWQAPASRGIRCSWPIYQGRADRSAIAHVSLGGTCERNCLSATAEPQPVGGVSQLSEPFNHGTPGANDVDNSTTTRAAMCTDDPGDCLGFFLAISHRQDRTNFPSVANDSLGVTPSYFQPPSQWISSYLKLRICSAPRGAPRTSADASGMH